MTSTLWIVNYPGETESEFDTTLRFIRENAPQIYQADAQVFQYHPEGLAHSKEIDAESGSRHRFSSDINAILGVTPYLVERDFSAASAYHRLERFVATMRELKIPNPYRMFEWLAAEERWRSMGRDSGLGAAPEPDGDEQLRRPAHPPSRDVRSPPAARDARPARPAGRRGDAARRARRAGRATAGARVPRDRRSPRRRGARGHSASSGPRARRPGRAAGAGVRPGGVVLIVLPTGAELLAAYFGVLLAGAVPGLVATPSNRVADTAVYGARVGAILANARRRRDPLRRRGRGDAAARAARLLGAPRVLMPDRAAARRPRARRRRRWRPDAIATVQYSSGSTGTPKGVLLTHRAMLNNMRAMRDGLGLGARRRQRELDSALPRHGADRRVPAAAAQRLPDGADPDAWTSCAIRRCGCWAIHRYRGAALVGAELRLQPVRDAHRRTPTSRASTSSAGASRSPPPSRCSPRTVAAFRDRFAPYGFRAGGDDAGLGAGRERRRWRPRIRSARRPRIEHDRPQAGWPPTASREPMRAGDGVGVGRGRALPRRLRGRRSATRTAPRLPSAASGRSGCASNWLFSGYHGDPRAHRARAGRRLARHRRPRLHRRRRSLLRLARQGPDRHRRREVRAAGHRGRRSTACPACARAARSAFGVLNEAARHRGRRRPSSRRARPTTTALAALRDAIRREVMRAHRPRAAPRPARPARRRREDDQRQARAQRDAPRYAEQLGG